ncbi:TLC domain-containing protein 2-like [Thrips palmi]|uniref:TLC domain-containing protein 2-like n=1 Tax=Thrips palmi TaxID=161013 RepID=A0A6P9A4W1_THRPL|nr:TLC domain-containing protein 2-like [Thrips palmi]XP_034251616.1 TLC domain-containing protein 2-like [Thrips palmi]
MDVNQAKDSNNAYLWVFYSFVSFCCTNYCLGFFVPSNASNTPHQVWRWKNIASSLVHSSITGIWSVICFLQIPEMQNDLINEFAVSAQGVISLSVGYFIYDFVDMAIHDRRRSTELLFHHVLVITCFGLSVCTSYYQGYSLVALLVEVNSIFLHLRQLMLLYGVSKGAPIYKANSVLNLGTFVVFRVFAMGGMLQWLLSHRSELTVTVFGLGVFSLIVIMGMNFQLLYRVLKSDYLKKSKPTVSKLASSTEVSADVPIVQKSDSGAHPSVQNSKTSVPSYEAELLLPIPNGADMKLD